MIETKRLFLRKISQEDIDLIFSINNPPECNFLGGLPLMSLETCKDLIDKWVEQYTDTDGIGVFCVEDKESKCKIGMAYILGYKEPAQLLIGFRLRRAHWDNGYDEEITGGFIKYAETNLNAHEIIAKAYQSDSNLRNVFERLGFEVSIHPDCEYELLYTYFIDNDLNKDTQ